MSDLQGLVFQIWKKCAFSARIYSVAMQYEEGSPEKWKTDWIYHSEYQNTILIASQCIHSSVSPHSNQLQFEQTNDPVVRQEQHTKLNAF